MSALTPHVHAAPLDLASVARHYSAQVEIAQLTVERDALAQALQSLLPMLAEWHEAFPHDIGDKEAPAIEAARAALSAVNGAAVGGGA